MRVNSAVVRTCHAAAVTVTLVAVVTVDSVVIHSIMMVETAASVVMMVSPIAPARIIIVVMITVPAVAVIRIAPIRIVVRQSPAAVPIIRIVAPTKTPIPIVIPWFVDCYIIVTAAIVRTVKSVDSCSIAVVDYNIGRFVAL